MAHCGASSSNPYRSRAGHEEWPPGDRSVLRLFADQVRDRPDAVAVRAASGTLTYSELDDRAARLAGVLLGRGVRHETPVALCLGRDLHLPVAVLAVLRAGGTYVPLDPHDPPARRDLVIADAGASVVLADAPLSVAGAEVVDLTAPAVWSGPAPTDPPDVPDDPRRAAYIIYTSGSTGPPKGVVVENRNLSSYVDGFVRRLALDEPLRFAMVQPLTVDSSVSTLYPPLCVGGELHLLDRGTALDPDRFADWVGEYGVDVLKIAPSHLRALQASPRFAELLPSARLIVGGEPSDWTWLRALQRAVPGCTVVNHYGPTETTVGVLTLAVTDHPDADWDIAPIGRPLPGVRVTVVDDDGDPVPTGTVGELVVTGPYVARGYHRRPELTEEAFTHGSYRTGDQVRVLDDGVIAYVGRRDDQVKVNGFRIELGEVDAALLLHPDVHASVTVVREVSGERAIVAYAQTPATPADLREHLRSRLPAHAVPQVVVALERIPLSAHGKIDRAALPPPPGPVPALVPALVPDGEDGALERAVTAAWTSVLGMHGVGADTNFFDVGGHSLLLVALQQRLREHTEHAVDLIDLLTHTTVRAQARLLSGRFATTPAGTPPRRVTPQQEALRRRRMQRRRSERDHR